MIDDKKKKNCLVFKGKEKWLKRQKTKNTWWVKFTIQSH
jgi:hypothetical protein